MIQGSMHVALRLKVQIHDDTLSTRIQELAPDFLKS